MMINHDKEKISNAHDSAERWTGWIAVAALMTSIISASLTFLNPASFDLVKLKTSLNKSETPTLENYTSGWLTGANSLNSVCDPVKREYENRYKNLDVVINGFEATSKDELGHVKYKYTCSFVAKSKS